MHGSPEPSRRRHRVARVRPVTEAMERTFIAQSERLIPGPQTLIGVPLITLDTSSKRVVPRPVTESAGARVRSNTGARISWSGRMDERVRVADLGPAGV